MKTRVAVVVFFICLAFFPLTLWTTNQPKDIIDIPSCVPVEVQNEPELIIDIPIVKIEIERSAEPEKSIVVKPHINPNKVPVTKVWNIKGVVETVPILTAHLQAEHGVNPNLVRGWNLTQLRRLHAYCHNGFSLEDLYEYF